MSVDHPELQPQYFVNIGRNLNNMPQGPYTGIRLFIAGINNTTIKDTFS
jgi:hypothetical protein